MKTRALAVGLLSLLAAPAAAQTPDFTVDVVVYGATSGGVIAAYAAKQYGKSVLLVEPGRHLGGMSSGGLGRTDIGNKHAITGLGLDFYRRLGSYYGELEAWLFEPKAAEQVYESYVDEAGVEVLYSRRVKSVSKAGPRIQSITLEYAGTGKGGEDLVVAGKQFIDASYEGDLMARAGVSYAVGREANSVYNELYNGVQLSRFAGPYGNAVRTPEFPDGVDPYRIPGNPASGLLPEIDGVGIAPAGTGDKGVQAYNFRMALCQGESRLPFRKPDKYEPARYELFLRGILAVPGATLRRAFIISRMPNGKTDWNNYGLFGMSTDYIGGNWAYPEADYAGRAANWKEHEDYQKGLLWYILTEPRIPQALREEMRSWGYCPDEFLDTDGWPHQLYVREARRMIGEHVMTEHDAMGRVKVLDGVGQASYVIDSHNIRRAVVDGRVEHEGNTSISGFPPYPISYRSLTPKRTEATNLLVPYALSASHSVFGSIRMEPVFMMLGQSSALAASMAIDRNVSVQEIDVAALQRELQENPRADRSTPDLLVDDGTAGRVRVTGAWPAVSLNGTFGVSVLKNEAKDGGSVRFTPEVRVPGSYVVHVYWPRTEGLASNVPVEIRHAGGTERVTLNMQAPSQVAQGNIAQWVPLGEYRFTPGAESWVEIGSRGADGVVLADAVLLVPVQESATSAPR